MSVQYVCREHISSFWREIYDKSEGHISLSQTMNVISTDRLNMNLKCGIPFSLSIKNK